MVIHLHESDLLWQPVCKQSPVYRVKPTVAYTVRAAAWIKLIKQSALPKHDPQKGYAQVVRELGSQLIASILQSLPRQTHQRFSLHKHSLKD